METASVCLSVYVLVSADIILMIHRRYDIRGKKGGCVGHFIQKFDCHLVAFAVEELRIFIARAFTFRTEDKAIVRSVGTNSCYQIKPNIYVESSISIIYNQDIVQHKRKHKRKVTQTVQQQKKVIILKLTHHK